MVFHARCSRTLDVSKTRVSGLYLDQRSPCQRYYSSEPAAQPEWFQILRTEMLDRKLKGNREVLMLSHDRLTAKTIRPFLQHPDTPMTYHKTLGNHLLYFNAMPPTNELLSDGTDVLHSPGGPWVRRMWAGGAIRIKNGNYYNTWRHKGHFFCGEIIKDVQLRGQGDDAKIFVDIERRIAETMSFRMYQEKMVPHSRRMGPNLLRQQFVAGNQWGKAILVENRKLVFMKERTDAEKKAVLAGDFTPVRYLEPPGEAQFSHTLTPTPALLFRFSALTLNAHAIHLDREYARNVEGHRDLLVHGPLSLYLLLNFVRSKLQAQDGELHCIHSIEYRNLTPLYCNEPMRLCVRQKAEQSGSRVYDVWIEGPTGGMAVKGTVHTALVPRNPKLQEILAKPRASGIRAPRDVASKQVELDAKPEEATQDDAVKDTEVDIGQESESGVSQPQVRIDNILHTVSTAEVIGASSLTFQSKSSFCRTTTDRLPNPNPAIAKTNPSRHQAPANKSSTTPPLTRKQKRFARARKFKLPIIQRQMTGRLPPPPFRIVTSLVQRELAKRLAHRHNRLPTPRKPRYRSPVRYYKTTKDHIPSEEEQLAWKLSGTRFARRGVTKVEHPSIRRVLTPKMEEAKRHRRMGDAFGGYSRGVDGFYKG